ncbi:hypothetical protein [Rhizobium laguerreae]|uniref:Uncharacterized protein n=1 Tax=Rhizobium laguerreae TaxID=1076926 RepID=A0A7Y2RBI1_9HYPH|nr:hypothetical protein [Rhizobium laguerreae]NNH67781.1 hypothetical protein [Rhizobium laguerreae]
MTSFSKLITKCLRAWAAWNDRKRMTRAMPDIIERKKLIEKNRRRHRRNRALLDEQRNEMTAILKGKM